MLRRITLAAVFAALLGSSLACNNNTRTVVGNQTETDPDKPIGNALIPGARELAPLVRGPAASSETILIPAHLAVVDKREVPSQRDGKILFIGTEVTGPIAPADRDTYFPHRGKFYRELEPGMRVEANQVVMLLYDREAYAALQAATVIAESSRKMYLMSTEVRKNTERIY